MSNEKFVIMFVCTGNTCRSPMAEVALRTLVEQKLPGRVEVISSGTSAASGFPATMYAVEAAKIWDCDLSSHSSQLLSEELADRSDIIFAMTPEHLASIRKLSPGSKDKSYLLKNFPDLSSDGEGVEDPIGEPLDRYNETFLEIGEYLGKHLDKIISMIEETQNA